MSLYVHWVSERIEPFWTWYYIGSLRCYFFEVKDKQVPVKVESLVMDYSDLSQLYSKDFMLTHNLCIFLMFVAKSRWFIHVDMIEIVYVDKWASSPQVCRSSHAVPIISNCRHFCMIEVRFHSYFNTQFCNSVHGLIIGKQ